MSQADEETAQHLKEMFGDTTHESLLTLIPEHQQNH
jgi:hypothetical protein